MYRGSFDKLETLKAAYPFVDKGDYAIVRGVSSVFTFTGQSWEPGAPAEVLSVISDMQMNIAENTIEIFTLQETQTFKVLFAQIEDAVIADTDEELSLINPENSRGSVVIPANTLKPGSIIRVKSTGIIGDTGTPDATLKIKMNDVDLIDSTVTMSDFGQDLFYDVDFLITVRTIGETGAVCGEGKTFFKNPANTTAGLSRALQMLVDVEIDTTEDITLDATYQWSDADELNSIISRNFLIEIAI